MYDVLIVEDDPMVAIINKQYVMQSCSFRVVGTCRDGISAKEFLSDNKVDLIILDQYMPRMTGLEFLRYLRQENIPASVIMVTAANDGEAIEEALRLGVVDYLVKPFSNTRFNQALNNFLERQNRLGNSSKFNQRMIDDLINATPVVNQYELPKGIQQITLDKIREYLKSRTDVELTGEELADALGISRVTVRRYMNYLIEQSEISGRMNYETGGRPSMLYRYIKV